tara:strand:- start:104 stop:451 length:348 start_codon:yes stop_codon:yes gene_type:complete
VKNFTLIGLLLSAAIANADCVDSENILKLEESSKDRIIGPFSVSRLERKNLVEIEETGEKIPFGYVNEQWVMLKSMMKEGDAIYRHKHKDGRFAAETIVLVRNNCVVFSFLLWIT